MHYSVHLEVGSGWVLAAGAHLERSVEVHPSGFRLMLKDEVEALAPKPQVAAVAEICGAYFRLRLIELYNDGCS